MAAGGGQVDRDREGRVDVRRASASPVAPIDDRTGSGDKAAGAAGDDWVPDEWRDGSDS